MAQIAKVWNSQIRTVIHSQSEPVCRFVYDRCMGDSVFEAPESFQRPLYELCRAVVCSVSTWP
jgi:hypothetical protein